ncbi:hypothetical protein CYG68_01980 [Morganella morganii]|uniref:Uncharacterized protein n=1 Tax=Morganella morganii TaxID=582 RepID=A0A8I0PZF7_MORMO|nr:hypothetical protein [Morganella morganii]MBE8611196.1 hypothetical protein [Morganella morganii]
MKKVEAIVTLILIDGVTYQMALPKRVIGMYAKHALGVCDAFEGKLIPCNFADIKPMEADGMPFDIIDSGAENEKV